jgi:hypothetical protein
MVAARVEVYQVATLFRCVVVVSVLLSLQKPYKGGSHYANVKGQLLLETIKHNYWKTQCATHRGEEKCIDDFGEETLRKEAN